VGLKRYVEKEVLFGVYGPGRRIAELVVEVRNVLGALAKILAVMAGMRINVLSSFLRAKASDEAAVWSSFVDLTDTEFKIEDVVERLKEVDVVLDVKFSKREGELAIDELCFPVTLMDERYVLFKVDTVGKAFSRLFEIFGSGAATIIHSMGVESGMRGAEKFKTEYGLEKRQALDAVLKEVMAKGWGVSEVEVFDERRNEAVIRVYELFECLPFKGRLKEPKSHLFRGYLEGAFKTIFKTEYMANETECIAKGDPYCRFIVTQRPSKQESI